MIRPHRFLIGPALTLLLGACTTWGHAGVEVLAQPVPERRPLEVWSGGQRYDVHGVRVVGDSVAMVPHWKPPACDSCRIVLSRAAVDSVRVRVHSPARTVVLAGILGGTLWLAAQFLSITPDY
jgi:hypothetical protein